MPTRFMHEALKALRQSWDWLTRPSAEISSAAEQRQARLLATMLVVLIPLAAVLGTLAAVLDRPAAWWADIFFEATLIVLAAWMPAYWISRTRRWRAGAALMVVGIAGVVFVVTLAANVPDFVWMLIIPLMIASLYLSVRDLVLLAVLFTVIVATLPMFDHEITVSDIVSHALPDLLVPSVVLMLIVRYHGLLAADRRRELAASESRFRLMAESAPVGINMTDARGGVTYVNHEWCKITGQTPEQALGSGWARTVHPDDREQVTAEWQRCVKAGAEFALEYRFLVGEGRVTWVFDRAMPTRDEGGAVTGFLGTTTEITDRVQAEQETGRLNVELAHRNQQLETLRKVGGLLTSQTSLTEVLDSLFDLLGELVEYDSVAIQMVDEDGHGYVAAQRGYRDPELDIPAAAEIFDRTLQERWVSASGDVIVMPDVSEDKRWISDEGSTHVRSWIGAALRVRGEFIGVLNVDSAKPSAFDQEAGEIVRAFANQAAIAIENARMYERIRRRNHHLTAMRRVTRRAVPERNRRDLCQAVAEALAEEFNYPAVAIMLGDDDTRQMETVALAGHATDRLGVKRGQLQSYDSGIMGRVMRHGKAELLHGPDRDPDFIPPAGPVKLQTILDVPILAGGRVIGIIGIATEVMRGLDHLDLELMMEAADEIGLHIENIDLYQQQAISAVANAHLLVQSEGRSRRLALLNEIVRTGTTMLDVDEMLQAMADKAAGIIDADGCYITLWDAGQKLTITAAAYGPMRESYRAIKTKPGAMTFTRAALEAGHPLVVEDVAKSEWVDKDVQTLVLEKFPARSLIVLPMHVELRDLGSILIAFNQPRQFSDEQVAWAEQAAEVIALALDRAQSYANLEQHVEERTAEVQTAYNQLLKLATLKDDFVANVSHELRMPLATMKLYHQLLESRPERSEIYVEHLRREEMRLEAIIEDLLDLSRMDQGRTTFTLADVNLNDVAAEYVGDRRVLAEDRNLKLTMRLLTKSRAVRADPALIGQALGVLLTNAMNYTPSGGAIRVQTVTRRAEGREWVGLRVKDTGPGIPPEEQPRLFERFFRGSAARKNSVPGTGLGLAIAWEIVDRHGGQIEVKSAGVPGKGASFTIWLAAGGPQSSTASGNAETGRGLAGAVRATFP